MLSTAVGWALFPAGGSGVSPARCGVAPLPRWVQRGPSVKPLTCSWPLAHPLWAMGGALVGSAGGTGKDPHLPQAPAGPWEMRHLATVLPGASSGSGRHPRHHPVPPASALPQCHLAATSRGWDTGPWLEPTGSRLPPGRPQHPGDRAVSPWHRPPRCRGVSVPERWRGRGGCAQLPGAAARQLPQSYKEMPEPAAASEAVG